MSEPRDGERMAPEDAATVVEPKRELPKAPSPRDLPQARGGLRDSANMPSQASGTGPSGTGTGTHGSLGSRGSSRSTSVLTPRETLQLQEVTRTRSFLRFSVALACLVSVSMALLRGDPIAKLVFLISSLAVVASCIWLGWLIRKDEGYTVERALVTGFTCIFAAFAGIYFFGVFSPAPVIIPFGLCVFGTSLSDRGTLAVFLTCAGLQAGLTILLMADVLPDHGMVRGELLSIVEKGVILVIIEATFFATFLIARVSRNTTLYAIEQHDFALRDIAQREALLREARGELREVLRAGGEGRYTGQTLDNYTLGKVIGRGAMGEVYEARHEPTGEEAAVKLLLEHVLAQEDHVQRFHREAKIVAGLNVANVVRVLAVAERGAAIPYIAMERLHGKDLSDYLREHKRMSLHAVLGLIRQVGAGLEAARASGVVHRDLKPRNIFLARYPEKRSTGERKHEQWKILDFGVSKVTSEDATMTRSRMVGTPSYMAPEQISGGEVDHRTDLFALGVIAYRALTGRPAFSGDVESEILHKVLNAMPPPPSRIVDLPPEIDVVMAIAIAKAPADRFDGADELAQALEAAARGVVTPELRARAAQVLAKHPWAASA